MPVPGLPILPVTAEGIAAGRRPAERLAEEDHRGSGAIGLGGADDICFGNAGRLRRPSRRPGVDQGFQLLEADCVGRDKGGIEFTRRLQRVHKAEGQGGIGAGEGAQMKVGACRRRRLDRVDHDQRAGKFRQPVLVHMRPARRRIATPDDQAAGVFCGARIESGGAVAEHIAERHMAGEIADRIRVDLGGADMVEEAKRKLIGDHRTGAGVMAGQDIRGPAVGDETVEPRRDRAERLVPGDLGECSRSFRTGALQRFLQPCFRIAPHPVIGEGAFPAERPPVRRMIRIAGHPVDGAVLEDDADAAAVVAIAGAGGQDGSLGHGSVCSGGLFRRHLGGGEADGGQARL